MGTLSFDVAHMLAGSLVLVSFMQLYQDRLYALLNTFALHAFILAASAVTRSITTIDSATSPMPSNMAGPTPTTVSISR